jgi:hypothetical protein
MGNLSGRRLNAPGRGECSNFDLRPADDPAGCVLGLSEIQVFCTWEPLLRRVWR